MIAVDASALLAFLLEEPGGELVSSQLAGSWLSSVNLAEALTRLSDLGIRTEPVPQMLQSVGVQLAAFGQTEASGVANLRAATRPHGLSLGDRSCLQLARSRGIPALTADTDRKSVV